MPIRPAISPAPTRPCGFAAKDRTNFLTYKGPKIDATTKTRREIDLPLPPGEEAARAWTGLLEALGFTTVGEVRKSRRKAHVVWQDRSVEVSLDEVEGLGEFAELELVVEDGRGTEEVSCNATSGMEDDRTKPPPSPAIDAAKTCIASLAGALGLEGSEAAELFGTAYSRQLIAPGYWPRSTTTWRSTRLRPTCLFTSLIDRQFFVNAGNHLANSRFREPL